MDYSALLSRSRQRATRRPQRRKRRDDTESTETTIASPRPHNPMAHKTNVQKVPLETRDAPLPAKSSAPVPELESMSSPSSKSGTKTTFELPKVVEFNRTAGKLKKPEMSSPTNLLTDSPTKEKMQALLSKSRKRKIQRPPKLRNKKPDTETETTDTQPPPPHSPAHTESSFNLDSIYTRSVSPVALSPGHRLNKTTPDSKGSRRTARSASIDNNKEDAHLDQLSGTSSSNSEGGRAAVSSPPESQSIITADLSYVNNKEEAHLKQPSRTAQRIAASSPWGSQNRKMADSSSVNSKDDAHLDQVCGTSLSIENNNNNNNEEMDLNHASGTTPSNSEGGRATVSPSASSPSSSRNGKIAGLCSIDNDEETALNQVSGRSSSNSEWKRAAVPSPAGSQSRKIADNNKEDEQLNQLSGTSLSNSERERVAVSSPSGSQNRMIVDNNKEDADMNQFSGTSQRAAVSSPSGSHSSRNSPAMSSVNIKEDEHQNQFSGKSQGTPASSPAGGQSRSVADLSSVDSNDLSGTSLSNSEGERSAAFSSPSGSQNRYIADLSIIDNNNKGAHLNQVSGASSINSEWERAAVSSPSIADLSSVNNKEEADLNQASGTSLGNSKWERAAVSSPLGSQSRNVADLSNISDNENADLSGTYLSNSEWERTAVSSPSGSQSRNVADLSSISNNEDADLSETALSNSEWERTAVSSLSGSQSRNIAELSNIESNNKEADLYEVSNSEWERAGVASPPGSQNRNVADLSSVHENNKEIVHLDQVSGMSSSNSERDRNAVSSPSNQRRNIADLSGVNNKEEADMNQASGTSLGNSKWERAEFSSPSGSQSRNVADLSNISDNEDADLAGTYLSNSEWERTAVSSSSGSQSRNVADLSNISDNEDADLSETSLSNLEWERTAVSSPSGSQSRNVADLSSISNNEDADLSETALSNSEWERTAVSSLSGSQSRNIAELSNIDNNNKEADLYEVSNSEWERAGVASPPGSQNRNVADLSSVHENNKEIVHLDQVSGTPSSNSEWERNAVSSPSGSGGRNIADLSNIDNKNKEADLNQGSNSEWERAGVASPPDSQNRNLADLFSVNDNKKEKVHLDQLSGTCSGNSEWERTAVSPPSGTHSRNIADLFNNRNKEADSNQASSSEWERAGVPSPRGSLSSVNENNKEIVHLDQVSGTSSSNSEGERAAVPSPSGSQNREIVGLSSISSPPGSQSWKIADLSSNDSNKYAHMDQLSGTSLSTLEWKVAATASSPMEIQLSPAGPLLGSPPRLDPLNTADSIAKDDSEAKREEAVMQGPSIGMDSDNSNHKNLEDTVHLPENPATSSSAASSAGEDADSINLSNYSGSIDDSQSGLHPTSPPPPVSPSDSERISPAGSESSGWNLGGFQDTLEGIRMGAESSSTSSEEYGPEGTAGAFPSPDTGWMRPYTPESAQVTPPPWFSGAEGSRLSVSPLQSGSENEGQTGFYAQDKGRVEQFLGSSSSEDSSDQGDIGVNAGLLLGSFPSSQEAINRLDASNRGEPWADSRSREPEDKDWPDATMQLKDDDVVHDLLPNSYMDHENETSVHNFLLRSNELVAAPSEETLITEESESARASPTANGKVVGLEAGTISQHATARVHYGHKTNHDFDEHVFGPLIQEHPKKDSLTNINPENQSVSTGSQMTAEEGSLGGRGEPEVSINQRDVDDTSDGPLEAAHVPNDSPNRTKTVENDSTFSSLHTDEQLMLGDGFRESQKTKEPNRLSMIAGSAEVAKEITKLGDSEREVAIDDAGTNVSSFDAVRLVELERSDSESQETIRPERHSPIFTAVKVAESITASDDAIDSSTHDGFLDISSRYMVEATGREHFVDESPVTILQQDDQATVTGSVLAAGNGDGESINSIDADNRPVNIAEPKEQASWGSADTIIEAGSQVAVSRAMRPDDEDKVSSDDFSESLIHEIGGDVKPAESVESLKPKAPSSISLDIMRQPESQSTMSRGIKVVGEDITTNDGNSESFRSDNNALVDIMEPLDLELDKNPPGTEEESQASISGSAKVEAESSGTAENDPSSIDDSEAGASRFGMIKSSNVKYSIDISPVASHQPGLEHAVLGHVANNLQHLAPEAEYDNKKGISGLEHSTDTKALASPFHPASVSEFLKARRKSDEFDEEAMPSLVDWESPTADTELVVLESVRNDIGAFVQNENDQEGESPTAGTELVVLENVRNDRGAPVQNDNDQETRNTVESGPIGFEMDASMEPAVQKVSVDKLGTQEQHDIARAGLESFKEGISEDDESFNLFVENFLPDALKDEANREEDIRDMAGESSVTDRVAVSQSDAIMPREKATESDKGFKREDCGRSSPSADTEISDNRDGGELGELSSPADTTASEKAYMEEFEKLILRCESGQAVDEYRFYCLQLYGRQKVGKYLTDCESSRLEIFLRQEKALRPKRDNVNGGAIPGGIFSPDLDQVASEEEISPSGEEQRVMTGKDGDESSRHDSSIPSSGSERDSVSLSQTTSTSSSSSSESSLSDDISLPSEVRFKSSEDQSIPLHDSKSIPSSVSSSYSSDSASASSSSSASSPSESSSSRSPSASESRSKSQANMSDRKEPQDAGMESLSIGNRGDQGYSKSDFDKLSVQKCDSPKSTSSSLSASELRRHEKEFTGGSPEIPAAEATGITIHSSDLEHGDEESIIVATSTDAMPISPMREAPHFATSGNSTMDIESLDPLSDSESESSDEYGFPKSKIRFRGSIMPFRQAAGEKTLESGDSREVIVRRFDARIPTSFSLSPLAQRRISPDQQEDVKLPSVYQLPDESPLSSPAQQSKVSYQCNREGRASEAGDAQETKVRAYGTTIPTTYSLPPLPQRKVSNQQGELKHLSALIPLESPFTSPEQQSKPRYQYEREGSVSDESSSRTSPSSSPRTESPPNQILKHQSKMQGGSSSSSASSEDSANRYKAYKSLLNSPLENRWMTELKLRQRTKEESEYLEQIEGSRPQTGANKKGGELENSVLPEEAKVQGTGRQSSQDEHKQARRIDQGVQEEAENENKGSTMRSFQVSGGSQKSHNEAAQSPAKCNANVTATKPAYLKKQSSLIHYIPEEDEVARKAYMELLREPHNENKASVSQSVDGGNAVDLHNSEVNKSAARTLYEGVEEETPDTKAGRHSRSLATTEGSLAQHLFEKSQISKAHAVRSSAIKPALLKKQSSLIHYVPEENEVARKAYMELRKEPKDETKASVSKSVDGSNAMDFHTSEVGKNARGVYGVVEEETPDKKVGRNSRSLATTESQQLLEKPQTSGAHTVHSAKKPALLKKQSSLIHYVPEEDDVARKAYMELRKDPSDENKASMSQSVDGGNAVDFHNSEVNEEETPDAKAGRHSRSLATTEGSLAQHLFEKSQISRARAVHSSAIKPALLKKQSSLIHYVPEEDEVARKVYMELRKDPNARDKASVSQSVEFGSAMDLQNSEENKIARKVYGGVEEDTSDKKAGRKSRSLATTEASLSQQLFEKSQTSGAHTVHSSAIKPALLKKQSSLIHYVPEEDEVARKVYMELPQGPRDEIIGSVDRSVEGGKLWVLPEARSTTGGENYKNILHIDSKAKQPKKSHSKVANVFAQLEKNERFQKAYIQASETSPKADRLKPQDLYTKRTPAKKPDVESRTGNKGQIQEDWMIRKKELEDQRNAAETLATAALAKLSTLAHQDPIESSNSKPEGVVVSEIGPTKTKNKTIEGIAPRDFTTYDVYSGLPIVDSSSDDGSVNPHPTPNWSIFSIFKLRRSRIRKMYKESRAENIGQDDKSLNSSSSFQQLKPKHHTEVRTASPVAREVENHGQVYDGDSEVGNKDIGLEVVEQKGPDQIESVIETKNASPSKLAPDLARNELRHALEGGKKLRHMVPSLNKVSTRVGTEQPKADLRDELLQRRLKLRAVQPDEGSKKHIKTKNDAGTQQVTDPARELKNLLEGGFKLRHVPQSDEEKAPTTLQPMRLVKLRPVKANDKDQLLASGPSLPSVHDTEHEVATVSPFTEYSSDEPVSVVERGSQVATSAVLQPDPEADEENQQHNTNLDVSQKENKKTVHFRLSLGKEGAEHGVQELPGSPGVTPGDTRLNSRSDPEATFSNTWDIENQVQTDYRDSESSTASRSSEDSSLLDWSPSCCTTTWQLFVRSFVYLLLLSAIGLPIYFLWIEESNKPMGDLPSLDIFPFGNSSGTSNVVARNNIFEHSD